MGCFWLGCSGFGFWLLLEHDTSVGSKIVAAENHVSLTVSNSVSQRSKDALGELIPDEGELRIIVAMHPKCPCTRTTLAELNRLLTNADKPTSCTVLVAMPATNSSDWLDTPSVDQAKRLPNTELLIDSDSVLADQLELSSSGEILVVKDDGVISFAGGITSSRSCSTKNPGSETVAKLLRGEMADPLSTPTFGCQLK